MKMSFSTQSFLPSRSFTFPLVCISAFALSGAILGLRANAADKSPAASNPKPATAATQTGASPAAKPKQKRLISLVLLLREPRQLDQASIADAAGVSKDAVESKPPYHLARLESGRFLVSSLAEPYFKDSAKVAADARDADVKNGVQSHRAWLSVDWYDEKAPPDVRAAYQQIGKMLASFGGADALVIYSPELDAFQAYNPNAKTALAGSDPLQLFASATSGAPPSAQAGAPQPSPASQSAASSEQGVSIADDDPRLKQARAEAKKRWPEFARAFKAKKGDQYYAVKGSFEESGNTEFMWLKVDEIDQDTVHGKLESQPQSIKNWTRDQDIHIKIANVDDWVYSGPDNKPVGGFTQQVLADAAKEPKPATQR